MRKSGDWSYVGFPGSDGLNISSVSSTPSKNKRPSPISENPPASNNAYRQPGSLLESKVIASIMQNEGTSRSAHASPSRPLSGRSNRCTSAMETLDRKPEMGNGPLTKTEPPPVESKRESEYAAFQMPARNSLMLSHEQPHSSFYMNPMADQDFNAGRNQSRKVDLFI